MKYYVITRTDYVHLTPTNEFIGLVDNMESAYELIQALRKAANLHLDQTYEDEKTGDIFYACYRSNPDELIYEYRVSEAAVNMVRWL